MRQSREELIEHLREHMGFIARSSEAFDAGDTAEAKRLATTTRVLVHEGRRGESLLKQLAIKDQLAYVDSGPPLFPGNQLGETQLTMMRVSTEGAAYLPLLGDGPLPPGRQVFFDPWTGGFTSRNVTCSR